MSPFIRPCAISHDDVYPRLKELDVAVGGLRWQPTGDLHPDCGGFPHDSRPLWIKHRQKHKQIHSLSCRRRQRRGSYVQKGHRHHEDLMFRRQPWQTLLSWMHRPCPIIPLLYAISRSPACAATGEMFAETLRLSRAALLSSHRYRSTSNEAISGTTRPQPESCGSNPGRFTGLPLLWLQPGSHGWSLDPRVLR